MKWRVAVSCCLGDLLFAQTKRAKCNLYLSSCCGRGSSRHQEINCPKLGEGEGIYHQTRMKNTAMGMYACMRPINA